MNYTQILLLIITSAVAVTSGFFVVYIRNKMTDEQRGRLSDFIKEAVRAAEQLFKIGMIKDRYKYVTNYLRLKGWVFNEADLRHMVEAAVYELNKKPGSAQEDEKHE
jgi:hypothetical protein